MPCSEKRARLMMDKKQAKAYWQKGIFCIKLLKEVKNPKFQAVALGIDPGSKREGYTVATEKHVVLNITTNTPDWVKKHIDTRRSLRNKRKYRNKPYKKSRLNRSIYKFQKIKPSIKARWDAKLRIISLLLKIIPINIFNIEDVCAKTKSKENKQWNLCFSIIEHGKNYFYNKLNNYKLVKTKGIITYNNRIARSFKKDKSNKLNYRWETHNVDSHILCEIVLNKKIKSYKGLWKIEFLEFHRRQLHVQNPIKNGVRKQYGTTKSYGYSRGSVIIYNNKLYYLGGFSKKGISIYSILNKKRVKRHTKIDDIKVMYTNAWRTQFLGENKKWKQNNYHGS